MQRLAMPETDTYDIKQVAKVVNGKVLNCPHDNAVIKRLLFDSRKLIEPEQTLFFAIKGKRHDGHLFLEDLYEKQVRNFVISDEKILEKVSLPEANVIKVPDVIRAMQKLAAHHRRKFDIPVIGITGSNGKTIVKEWLNQLLSEDFEIARSPKSFNSQIGVPLSVWLLNNSHTLGIFEAGISQPGEMENLQEVIQPNIGIFTNIGEAHAEGFLNIRHKVKEKLRLFINSEILIYCKDYHEITQSISEIKHQFLSEEEQEERFRLFTWSKHTEADLRVTKIRKKKDGADVYGLYDNNVIKISLPFADDASIENAVHCWATMLYLKYDNETIEKRINRLTKISMRLELKDGINSCSIINDSYNSDIRSLGIALDFLNQQQQQEKKTVILSDILQSGKDEQQLYSEVKDLLTQKKVSRFIGIGKAISSQQRSFTASGLESEFYENTEDFLKNYSDIKFNNETILIKGARKFQFERISKLLEHKIHKTVLEINLNALVHNLQAYHDLLKPETKIMAMVKAFSYGSGSYEIANVLQYNLVDYLTVAYADEGLNLRKTGITLPIMVMNPEERSFETMINNTLEPEIYSLSVLRNFKKAIENIGLNNQNFPIHLKIDTGMHRLGFIEEDIPQLLQILENTKAVKVKSIFSHLSASDDPAQDEFSRGQIQLFETLSDRISKKLAYPVVRHILNSGGIVRFPEAQFDMVRLGIGLYGIDTTGIVQGQLEQVSTLKSTISQIKLVRQGKSVGYNRSFKAKKETKIAVVGIGYADGIDRRLGNGNGQVMIKGQLVPIIGNVCMDMCMVDISDIEEVNEGEEVILFGKELPIEKVAEMSGTIPYEILTGISSRVKRVYFQE